MKVIGTELYSKGIDVAVKEFIQLTSEEPTNKIISPSDAHVLVLSRTIPELKRIVDSFFWHLPDGMPSAWIMKLKGAKGDIRCSGPDFFKRIIEETRHLPIKHYLCGGKQGIADSLKQKCISWGNNNIVGTYSPPFCEHSEDDLKQIAGRINEEGTNILWISLGTPKQLYFAHRISKYTNVQFILTVGAAFDFHTGNVKKAPLWIQKFGLEWFYRTCQEPKRLFKRYVNVVPRFIIYNLLDR